MACQEHGMWEVLEVLRRLHRGESQSRVASVTGRTRKTIRRYARLAEELGWRIGSETEPDEALAARILDRIRPGPDRSEVGQTEGLLVPHLEQIQSWLEGDPGERGLTLTKVHRLLERRGVVVPYSSLHRFAVERCEFGKSRSTVRCAPCRPGELAEIDFGRLGYLRDPETGRRCLLWALVVILVYSRHLYVHVTRRQTLHDVIDGLESAWGYFGGVPHRVILDYVAGHIIEHDVLATATKARSAPAYLWKDPSSQR